MSVKNRVKELFTLVERFNDAMQSLLCDCLDQANQGNMNWFLEDFLPVWFNSKHSNAINNHALRQWLALSGLELKFEKGTYKGLGKSQELWGKQANIEEREGFVNQAKLTNWYELGVKENTTFKLPEISLKGIATTMARVETFDNEFDLERYIRDLRSEFKQARVKASVWHSEHETEIQRELEKMEHEPETTKKQASNIEKGISNIKIIEPSSKDKLLDLPPMAPAIKNYLRENGLDLDNNSNRIKLSKVKGSGKNGAITKADVEPLVTKAA